MKNYACIDSARKIKITPEEAAKRNRDNWYYCRNINCNAHLYIKSIDGSQSPYFAATRRDCPHVDGCYGSSGEAAKMYASCSEVGFNFEQFIDHISLRTAITSAKSPTPEIGRASTSAITPTALPPHTLKKVYQMCKELSISYVFAGKRIGEMLLDNRSFAWYKKGVFGAHIIESRPAPRFYDKDAKIYLEAPLNSPEKYTFVLSFSDSKLFTDMKDTLFHNRNKTVVLAGFWKRESRYNHFSAEVSSKKQYCIIKTAGS